MTFTREMLEGSSSIIGTWRAVKRRVIWGGAWGKG